MKCVCLRTPSLNQTSDEAPIECDVLDELQTIEAESDHIRENTRIDVLLSHELRHMLLTCEYQRKLQITKISIN